MSGQKQQRQQPHRQNYHTDMPVGEILRQTRLHYGQSLEDVEAVLRIKASQLAALENGEWDSLPGRVYIIGFIRTYAEYLGLDGGRIVHLLKVQYLDNKSNPVLHFPVPASESKLPNKYMLFSSLVALFMIVSVWGYMSMSRDTGSKDPQGLRAVATGVSPVPDSLKIRLASSLAIQALPPPPEAAVVAAIEPAAGTAPKEQIILKATEDTWIEIRNAAGKVLISRILNPGDSYIVPDEEGLVMDTGNAGGLQITMGEDFSLSLGKSGDIVRGVILDADELLKDSEETVSSTGN